MRTPITVNLPQIIGDLALAATVVSVLRPACVFWALPTIWIVVLILSVPFAGDPRIGWISSTSTSVTTKRIFITRKGNFTRTGHDLPPTRISDVQSRRASTTASLAAARFAPVDLGVGRSAAAATSPRLRWSRPGT